MNPYGCFFSFANHLDRPGVTIRADSEDGDCVAAHLATPVMEEVWRTVGPTAVVDIDFGSPVETGVVALACWRGGLVFGGSVRLQLDGGALDTGWLASGVDPERGYWVWRPAAPVASTTLRLSLDAGTDPYGQFARLWVGRAFEPGWGFAPGAGLRWADAGASTRGPSGRIVDSDGVRYRWVRVAFDAADQADADAFEDGQLATGKTRQFLFCRNGSAANRQTILCHATEVGEIVDNDGGIYANAHDLTEDT